MTEQDKITALIISTILGIIGNILVKDVNEAGEKSIGVEPSPNNFVEPKPTKQKVEPVEPCQTFSDVEPELVEPNKNSEPQPKAENANSKIIEGKEYVFIEGR
ncbi:22482_t:CDS:2 [Racocetra persica]|uniref:22482_t:CDS:1 n=1 Tax=Racocetra persica TaxID=160502 RepID=A0ACA9MRB7_9GLOM|nr:22482_t:CDS:2 [Racocetra persica]